MSFFVQLLIGSVAAVGMAATAYRMRLLTRSGAVASAAVGVAVFGFGGVAGAVPLLAFFVTSNLLGRWRRARKESLGYEKGGARDAAQVFANGGVAALAILASQLVPTHSVPLHLMFAAAVAEANADTWATEIGSAAGGSAVLITTFRPVETGRSGGVSIAGTLAALAGAAMIGGIASLWLGAQPLRAAALVTICGFAGCLVDSLVGAIAQARYATTDGRTSERQVEGSSLSGGVSWVNNDAVNTLGTVAAALAAWALSAAIR